MASAVAFHFGKGLSHAADFHHLALLQPGAAPRGTETIIVAVFFFSGVQAIHAQVRRGPVASGSISIRREVRRPVARMIKIRR